MKTKISLVLAILIFAGTSFLLAQDDDGKKNIGIRAGWQFAGLYEDGSLLEGSSELNSFYVGLYKDTKLVPILFLGTGLEYAPVGVTSSDIDAKLVLHYLSIPIDVKVKLGPVFALGGLAANFRLAEKFTLLGEDVEITDDEKSAVFDLPVFLGVGVNIFMLNIEIRYYYGLLDVYSDPSVNARYLQIGAGIKF